MNQQISKDTGGTISVKYYVNSILQVPTAATLTIYNEGGAVKLLDASASISAAGVVSYIVLPALCDAVYHNWKAVWKLTISGAVVYRTTLFDIVRTVIYNPVIDSDILNRAPFVKEMNYRKTGTAASGTTTTIVCNNLTEEDAYWTGGNVEITDGTNNGERRQVISFASKTLTVAAFPAAIDNTSKFVVIRSFNKELTEAFNKLMSDLFTKGIKVNLIIDSEQLREYIIILTLHFICSNFAKSPIEIWFEKANEYKTEYTKMLGSAVFNYDDDDDGNINAGEGQISVGQISGVR